MASRRFRSSGGRSTPRSTRLPPSSRATARRCCTGTRHRGTPSSPRRQRRRCGSSAASSCSRSSNRASRMSPDGTVRASRVWKRFRADRPPRRFLDFFEQLPERLARDRVRPQRWRWALRDIDFEVAPGESVGLIGSNGSGKSTLLKILHQIMYPYAGSVEVAGRVGALIEVRSGIHPQLTGRENIAMFGALLGLNRRTVASSFDEIVGFAELEHAVDRQVKFY